MNQAITDCLNGWNSLGEAFCSHAGSAFVQSALLVVLLFALDLLWRRRVRAVFRYGVWLLVLLKLVLPPTLSLPTGIGYWAGDHLPIATDVSEHVSLPTGDGRLEQHPPAAAPVLDTAPAVPPSPDVMEPAAPAAPAVVPATSLTWQGVVLLFWSAGVLAFVALVAQRLRFVRGLVAASTPAGPELLGLLEECARQMGVRRPVGLRTLDTLPSPAVCGLWRPTILMPAALVEKLSSEGLQAALIHELAHIKRADLWVNAVQTLLQIIYFYNPFVWLANAVIRRTCEEAVDETVLVALGGRAKNYSNTLIDISEMAFWKADFGLRLVGVAESKRALQGRIKHMLTRPIPKSTKIGALGTTMILVVAAVLLPMARGTQVRPSGTSGLMDRLQKEDDPELAELIRMAVAHHKGAGEKEILEITRRVTQSHAQILLLDAQIAQATRKIEATSTSAKTRGRLLLAKKEFEAKRMTEMGNLREITGIVPKVPFDKQPTGDLNTWLNLQVLDQRVVVYDALKPFQDYWALWRENVAGVLSEEATLDYIRGRLKDRKNLPMRITMNYRAESRSASERLRDAVFALARETHTDMDVEVSLELIWWVSATLEAPFFCREGKIRTLYSTAMARPDGRPPLFQTGLVVVEPNDLEQHILWRLTYPGNLPIRLRIEYDQASAPLARQVAGSIKTTAQRLGVADLLAVAQALIEPVPETAFLGRWEARRKGYFQAIDIQRQGVCQVMMGDGTDRFQAGASVKGTWTLTSKEILVDIGDGPRGYGTFYYLASINERGNLVVDRTGIRNQGYFNVHDTGQMIFQKLPPQSERAATALEAKPTPERAGLRGPVGIGPRSPFGELSTPALNAWVKLHVLEQKVVVLDTLKGFSDNWALAHHKVVGAFSERETLDYLRGRWKDGKSLPMRIHLSYPLQTSRATQDLRQKIFALAREANAEMDTEVRLEESTWVGSGESPFYLREGKIRTFYPGSFPRPDGGPRWLTSGLVDPNDLEQHILWRLTMPMNVPLTFHIEYDEASSALAKQVADTARAVVKRVGLTDLAGVTGTLVEPVPESAFVGKWQALGNAVIQSVEFQSGGGFQVVMGEGSPVIQAGTSVKGTWFWTVREILLDIGDPVLGRKGNPPYFYRVAVNGEGNLVIDRGEIYPQGSFMYTRPPQMIFQKVK